MVGFPQRRRRPLRRRAQRHAEDGIGPEFIIRLGADDDRGGRAGGLDLAVRHHPVGLQRFRQADPEKLVVVSSFGEFPQVAAVQQGRLPVGGADHHRDPQGEYRPARSSVPIVGEFLAANAGLGYLIIYGQNIFKMSLVMTSLVILTVIAGVMYY